jgi:hypothetical protein
MTRLCHRPAFVAVASPFSAPMIKPPEEQRTERST